MEAPEIYREYQQEYNEAVAALMNYMRVKVFFSFAFSFSSGPGFARFQSSNDSDEDESLSFAECASTHVWKQECNPNLSCLPPLHSLLCIRVG